MLRPSLPIMRPFMSSSGSLTAVTVRSAVTSLAIRSIVSTRIVCARSSASSVASCCSFATRFIKSCLTSRSVIFISFSAASFFFSPAIFSSFSCWRVRMPRISLFSSSTSSSCLRSLSLRLSSSSNLRSSEFSRSTSRFSVFFSSRRRSCSILSASSFAFNTMSLALRSARATSFSAVSLPLVCTCLSYATLPPTPIAAPTIAAIIPSIIVFLSLTIALCATQECSRQESHIVRIIQKIN